VHYLKPGFGQELGDGYKSGKYWDHAREVKEALHGVRKNMKKLEGVQHPDAKSATQKAQDVIKSLENAIKGIMR